MIIVDNALRRAGRAGQADPGRHDRRRLHGQGLTNQIMNSVPGMGWRRSTTASRSARVEVFGYAGRRDVSMPSTQQQLDEDASAPGGRSSPRTPFLSAARRADRRPRRRDRLGRVRRQVVLEAFQHGKYVVLMNAELDATIGPILQIYAGKHGVILSACDGDEPGVQMNLYRWVQGTRA